MAQATTTITTIIPTRDEAIHIERCIDSARALGPVFVVDSGSTDDTRARAERLGATVVVHAWAGYAAQKNWALDALPIEDEWVLFLDADEWLTPALRDELAAATITGGADGYFVPRQNIFMGRVLKHAWWYPDYQLRLFRRARGRFEDRAVHEQAAVRGATDFLREPLMHENLKGIDAFVERHLRYAQLEAEEILKRRAGQARGQRPARLFGSWPERRRWLKTHVWYRLPMRPAIRFCWLYFVRRGFLDGRAGRVYCQLIAAADAMVDAKLLELEQQRAIARGQAREP